MTLHQTVLSTERQPVLTSRELSFTAGSASILKPVSLDLQTGVVCGLLGHNGSGKSTLVKLLARQMVPTTGTLQLKDVDFSLWKQKDFARHIAYLPQHMPPAQGLLVEELVSHGRYPWHGAFRRFTDLDRQKVDEALRLTNTAVLRDRQVDNLSGGERQRVWIAMLIAQDAKCLLLDEPISALDVSHQVEVLSLIRDLAHTKKISVLMVLHDINMAGRFCDRLFALRDGELIADGTPKHILQRETLANIFGVEMGVLPHPEGEGLITYVA
ncbi:ABC transporter ATP-binding protein [Kiloniella majae]|uniref:ABC transporter ATP-binding protein n=1 Tax=Kiloniella majae TaxID=1938558 RepID=UPI000A27911E|nr:ATP-binding cassette domain-containing protein [Kiloniella majae]